MIEKNHALTDFFSELFTKEELELLLISNENLTMDEIIETIIEINEE